MTLDDYRHQLPVNKYRLDDELELQPDLMMRIASEVTIRKSRELEAKDELARAEAHLAEEFREDAEKGKATKGEIDGYVLRHPERREAWRKYQAARSDHENWSSLLDAWRERGFVMKHLTDLWVAQYFSRDSLSGSSISRQARDEANDALRARMRQAGHQPYPKDPAADGEEATRHASGRRNVRV